MSPSSSSTARESAEPIPARPDLSVVLVGYNSAPFIGDCIRSVEETVTCSHEILVVDNASLDGTADAVRRAWPGVLVMCNDENLGFSRASNRGMRAARGRHLLLLNGDATVRPGALDALVEHLDRDPNAGAVAPRLLNPDGTDQGTARSVPTPAAAILGRRSPLTRLFPGNRWSRRYLEGRDRRGPEPFGVDWVSGACLMVPQRVADEVGLLDEGFFMYWEDADWCRRIRGAGYTVACVPAAEVVHAEGGSRRGWPARQVRHFHRSAYRYYAKHHAAGARVVLRPVAAAALALRALAVVSLSAFKQAASPRAPRGTGSGGRSHLALKNRDLSTENVLKPE